MMALRLRRARKASLSAHHLRDTAISCHHNYVAEERYDGVDLLVTRKGAIRAGIGELGHHPRLDGHRLVHREGPRQRGVVQLGLARRRSQDEPERGEEALHAAGPGGADRGVECRKDSGVIDEIPGAYKAIEQVMAAQRDLVEVVAKLKQVICVKG